MNKNTIILGIVSIETTKNRPSIFVSKRFSATWSTCGSSAYKVYLFHLTIPKRIAMGILLYQVQCAKIRSQRTVGTGSSH